MLFFPVGIACCCMLKEKQCVKCNRSFSWTETAATSETQARKNKWTLDRGNKPVKTSNKFKYLFKIKKWPSAAYVGFWVQYFSPNICPFQSAFSHWCSADSCSHIPAYQNNQTYHIHRFIVSFKNIITNIWCCDQSEQKKSTTINIPIRKTTD